MSATVASQSSGSSWRSTETAGVRDRARSGLAGWYDRCRRRCASEIAGIDGFVGSTAISACSSFAIGTGAHGIGTARAFQESEEAGAFSGLAMGLCGLVTAVLFPLGVWLVRALQ